MYMQLFHEFIKLSQLLLESPQYVDKDYELDPGELTQPNLYSQHTLSSQYEYIGELNLKDEIIELYIQEIYSKYVVIGVRKDTENGLYKRCLFSMKLIEFTNPDEHLKELGKKCLSVSLVHCDIHNRFSSISTQTYLLLSNMGYVIISDELHYKGAKSLWKKLATLGLNKVRVFNQDTDTFIIGNDNSTIYNGHNISDDIIWGNSDKMSILLTLSTK